jgi:methyl-accepting chemotaxis protein
MQPKLTSSEQPVSASHQAGQATSQIAATIPQVSHGVQQQTEGLTRTVGSIRQVSLTVDGIEKNFAEPVLINGNGFHHHNDFQR